MNIEQYSNRDRFAQAAHNSINKKTKGWKRILPFMGPAFIAAVAYIDPGNFATNMGAGSKYGYMLLWVVVVSNLLAVLIQTMSAKLGIATGLNLAEVSREKFSKKTTILLWIQSELVIMATDLAEFIGATLGIHLLFKLPLLISACVAVMASFAILELQRKGFRFLEAVISALIGVVVLAFGLQVFYAEPELIPLLKGLVTPKFSDATSVFWATGILGATVMPHAIYLHSSLTQKRVIGKTEKEKKEIFRLGLFDTVFAMLVAGAINACLLIIAAALFFKNGAYVEDLDVVYNMLGEYIGIFASILFGVGLLVAGLASSSIGIMSGDVVMQGFIKRRIPFYLRRAVSIIPPFIVIALEINATKALVVSQVILSFGIAFALIPLVRFTSDKKIMGELVNKKITTITAWIVSIIVIVLNLFLIYKSIFT